MVFVSIVCFGIPARRQNILLQCWMVPPSDAMAYAWNNGRMESKQKEGEMKCGRDLRSLRKGMLCPFVTDHGQSPHHSAMCVHSPSQTDTIRNVPQSRFPRLGPLLPSLQSVLVVTAAYPAVSVSGLSSSLLQLTSLCLQGSVA